ncbi:MAG TPA: hypothetical protein VFT87_00820 [Candidatus Saccharimonadales bacterium]|nr:hypothetical protein [Candidatus Saccharimonadales bacterium]
MAQPTCKLFVLTGVQFQSCAGNVIRVTNVADEWNKQPRYAISETGKDYAPYDPNVFQAPVGFVAAFKEECKGCSIVWQVTVRNDIRLSKVLAVCRGGKSKGGGCDDMGDPQHLRKTFGEWLRYSEQQTLYIYYRNVR